MGNHISSPEISASIRVLVADRTRMNSQLLADALIRDQTFRVIEPEPSEAAILAAASSESPDVVLLSSMLEDSPTLGFQVARHLRTAYPKIRTVMLLDASGPDAVVEAFRAGARGVFSRAESLNNLAKCIYSAYAGQVWANSRELGYLLDALSEAMPVRWGDGDGFPLLSKREQDVVRCVADGLSNREIARRLNLTEHTVKNYLFRVFDKLGVSSRVEVVLYAFRLSQSQSSSNPGTQASEAEAGNVVALKRSANDRKLSPRLSRRRGLSHKTRK
jgi:two-component system, NarL family, nitrate/nitrite response regulator NarL